MSFLKLKCNLIYCIHKLSKKNIVNKIKRLSVSTLFGILAFSVLIPNAFAAFIFTNPSSGQVINPNNWTSIATSTDQIFTTLSTSVAHSSSSSSRRSSGSRPLATRLPKINESIISAVTTTETSQYAFIRNLYYGIVGGDVRALQIFLNAHSYVVSVTGAGSIGNETTYFGPATQVAVIKF